MSRSFDGVDDKVDCGSASVLDQITTVTYCFWAFPTNGVNGPMISKDQDTTKGKQIYIRNTGSGNFIRFLVEASTGSMSRSTALNSISTNVWSYICVTWNGNLTASNAHIYINFSEPSYQADVNGSGTFDDSSGNLLFGINGKASPSPYTGILAHIQIFNRILSINEMKQVGFYPGSIRNGIIGHWPLWGGSPEPDYSGYGNHGTVTGAKVSSDNPPINGMFYPRVFGNEYAMTTPAGGGGWPYTNTGCHVLLDRWRRVA